MNAVLPLPTLPVELENYRTAMRKMADDIIILRRQVGQLESENSRLRSDLSLHQDLGRTLLEDTDVDVMTKAEIIDRLGNLPENELQYFLPVFERSVGRKRTPDSGPLIRGAVSSLKFKLASETSAAAAQRGKVQQLQNELIKKNDSAKELVRLQRAHQQQQTALQRCQGRLARLPGLEATVRQQEKVIEKMEKLLDSKLKGKNKENTEKSKQVRKQAGERVFLERECRAAQQLRPETPSPSEEDSRRKEIESVLAAENSRLRMELEKLRLQPPPVIIQQPMQVQLQNKLRLQPPGYSLLCEPPLTSTQETFPDTEKLSLLSQLERANTRIRTLESQLEENSRRWGKEKQDMLTRLSEHNHGFTRTATMILHDLPLTNPSLSGPGRHRKLDPLK
ncbi:hypothetical protein JZ751_015341 [Albula glossodonta]|uniref:Coiled-coil domain-containing protein 33 n=1 Tax=Albula glossodonta TaxID=121402 RepID=A0A8T2MWJ0_9TELE|nr:hypothetical protein JZ751_015341 [Albula glossodonta]